jgi:DNA-binding transcriptional LysR family regulator
MPLIIYIRDMNAEDFDLNLVHALDALLVEESVTRAAARTGLSQPAMSHCLRRLRAALDDPLLVRAGATMELTSRALALREPVALVLEGARRLLEPVRFDPATSNRRFVVMMPDLAASLIAPALIEHVAHEAPDVCVEITPWRGSSLITERFLRRVDVITTNRGDSFPNFRRETLYTDRDVLAVRLNHPISAALEQQGAFVAARHVAVLGRGEGSDQIDDWLATLGIRRKIALVASSYLQALHIVAQTDLVAFVPARLVAIMATSLGLKAVTPPFDPGMDTQFMFYPASARTDPGSCWFRSALGHIARNGTKPAKAAPALRRRARAGKANIH